jgi:hypothetical protein
MYYQLYGCDGVGLGYETYVTDAVRFKTASFFECFPYVCPEPVLAK